ncbi:MAG: carbon-nitrogen hydrolase family protein [Pirellulaceae bacterium]
MNVRIALANVRVGKDSKESLDIALETIAQAGSLEAAIVCFPESFVPGYRIGNTRVECDINFLERAWSAVDQAARKARIAVILGTERQDGDRRVISARVTNSDGELLGFQDKVQLDPSEEGVYSPGSERRVFQCGDMTFGIVICHEGWRYPETVRSAARSGAQIVFHPHTELVEGAGVQPSGFADPLNSFHEKAALCRAAENTCYFATVNNAIHGASTTSAVVSPDGTLLAHHPYGQHGLLVSDIDLSKATGFLAHRLKSASSLHIAN